MRCASSRRARLRSTSTVFVTTLGALLMTALGARAFGFAAVRVVFLATLSTLPLFMPMPSLPDNRVAPSYAWRGASSRRATRRVDGPGSCAAMVQAGQFAAHAGEIVEVDLGQDSGLLVRRPR